MRQHRRPYDPYAKYRPYILRWDGSVILSVLPSTLITTIISGIVCLLYEHYKINISVPATLTPVFSIVVGLLLTYRTNTAYDRQGRRLWSKMIVAIRGILRHILVDLEPKSPEDLQEQKAAINLLIGFAFSTKHYLREEGTECDDLIPFISNINTTIPDFELLALQEAKVIEKERKEKRNLRSKIFKWIKNKIFKHKEQQPNNFNLPLTITLYLTSYVEEQFAKKNISNSTAKIFHLNLNALIDSLSGFERILRTPIPLAYAIHLSQTVWVYCIGLPFQLVSMIHYVTIPLVLIVSFILFGIETIGEEIENPFGYDDNDLDLDDLCNVIKIEFETITKYSRPKIEKWLYDQTHQPSYDDIIMDSEPSGISTFDSTSECGDEEHIEEHIDMR
ncbi:11062_t:CDS:2 [Gigaspora margarita]|uniref:11062_t:CDS:1 n=1 Tax=Gigaspora margarita TaxID=4874 RepID=A0ABN7V1V3_GIGMA|nr:11062_t:CDS:2 [Gigaspora margarita]